MIVLIFLLLLFATILAWLGERKSAINTFYFMLGVTAIWFAVRLMPAIPFDL